MKTALRFLLTCTRNAQLNSYVTIRYTDELSAKCEVLREASDFVECEV